MPGGLILIAGTETGVGKTWVAAQLIRNLRTLGTRVAARKPVQSFRIGEGATDAEILAAASGEAPHQVCPQHRWYPLPMAPPVAAEALRRPSFTLADLLSELSWPEADLRLVEGVGGPCSPLAADGDTLSLAARLRPDLVVLVAGSGLGAINAVRLGRTVFARWRVVVVMNRFEPADPVHASNRAWLAERDGLDVLVNISDLAERLAPA